jgi:4-hydroxybenzoyl-CoA thioesterase
MPEPTEFVLSTQPFVVRRRVRWGECDPAGVVYTPRFTDYLVSAVSLLHEHVLGDEAPHYRKDLGIDTPCKGMSLVFQGALWPNDWFDMAVSIGEIRNASYDVLVKARTPDGRPVFEGVFSPVCIPRNERRAVSIPEDFRRRLQAAKDTP